MTHTTNSRIAWLVLAASLSAPAALASPPAPAPRVAQSDDEDPDTKRAKQHFYKGEKLFALGKFGPALKEYEAAFQTKPLPEFLFNIGQCHRNLGNYEAAIFSFRKYLKLKPNAANREAVDELIAELDKKIAEVEAAERKRREAELLKQEETEFDPTGPVDTPSRPIYKKWWFWTGAAVTAAAATTATILIIRSASGLPDSDLGNVDFGK